jgi:NTP pyrophosphatase (non-canonical NTP hydrolase)
VARQVEYKVDGEKKVPLLSYWGNALAGEVGEACNIIKKIDRAKLGWKGSPAPSVEKLADELADAKIYIALLEADLGIDGDAALERVFNRKSEELGMTTRLRMSP